MSSKKIRKQRKIAVLGFMSVGKSAVTLRYCENTFDEAYNPTIETTYQKYLKLKGQEFDLEIVDVAGMDEFAIFDGRYSLGIHGYVLVYSVTQERSLEVIKSINEKILNFTGTDHVPRVIVGNKTDLASAREVLPETGQKLAEQWKCGFVECSAKLNHAVEDVFIKLVEEMERENGGLSNSKEKGCILL
eukprot:GCRY01002205.1.p1 GENE.GCRY01002205.1~~GCRY01002205.1.p1  ORF type:complete len:189 (-),score=28.75 GCRY01002205.1:562-1128(-)